MDQNFLSFLTSQFSKEKDKIVIMPFHDNHVGFPDETLFYGLPFAIYDMFSETTPQMAHPYLSYSAVKELGISGQDLTQLESIEKVAAKFDARYVIFGSFQRSMYSTVRIIINLYDHTSKTTLPRALEFTTNLDDSLFVKLSQNVILAFNQHKSAKTIKQAPYTSPSMQTFRYYSKGLAYATRYDTSNLEVAVLWFEKALKESFQKYDDAALGLARVHFMTALIQQSQKMDFTQNWMKAERALQSIRYKPKRMIGKYLVSFRFIQAQTAFVQGITAYEVKNMGLALSRAKEGLSFLPEHGLMQNLFHLSGGETQNKNIVINNAVCF